MEKEPVYKKFYRKADKHLNGQVEAKHGKQTNQKIKPYVVLQFLLKYSDENNVCSAFDIIAFLEDCGLFFASLFCIKLQKVFVGCCTYIL